MKRFLSIFIITLTLSSSICRAQSVGVVMSGGGAKGLYHIGTIEALEESGVPIDYVAGTSMGAIIAALYASGYSTEQMREIATSGKLERWINGRIDDNFGAYFRSGSTLRESDPIITYRFNTEKNRPDSLQQLAKSLISSTQIDMATVDLFAPSSVQSKGDFSKLMIPMLCVASDITAGEAVIFTEGDLGQAVRASMALPVAFKPIVDKRGHILFDGGIYDNFPWRQMKEHFNPDIIIGSVCGIDAYNTTDSWSNTNSLSLLDQVLLLTMTPSNYDIPSEYGVVIKRDVPTSMIDFAAAAQIIEMGYYDTLDKINSILERISPSSLKSEEQYLERRERFKSQNPELIFDKYNITGLDQEEKQFLESFMLTSRRQQRLNNSEAQQREMNFEELQTALYTSLASEDFTTSYPTVGYDSERQRFLFEIGMERKPSLKATIGGNVSSTPFNQLYAGISYRTIKRVSRELFGELYVGALYSAGRLGYRADLYTKAPMFFDLYYTFSMKNLQHGNFGNLTTIDNTLSLKKADQVISLGIGAPLRQRSLAKIQLNAGTETYNYSNGLPTDISMLNYWGVFYKSRFNHLSSRFLVDFNTINNPYFPTQGARFSMSGIGVIGRESSYAEDLATIDSPHESTINILRETRSWFGTKIQFAGYLNPMKNGTLSLGLTAEGVYTTIPDMYTPMLRQLLMPSYSPITHTNMVYMPEFSAPRYAAVGGIAKIKVWREVYLKGEFYSMIRDTYDETMRISEESGFSMHYITQGSLMYHSPIGPMSISLTKYNLNNWDNLYLTFNFGYPIFAPKGTYY